MGEGRSWEVVEEVELADYEVFRVRRQRARSPRTGSVHSFHLVAPPDSVVVVAEDNSGRLVMVEQFRHGVRRVMLEFPAGILEPGEDPLEAGLRELEEETGFCPASAEILGRFHTDPAIQSNVVTVVYARECAERGRRNEDAGEDVGVRLVSRAELMQLVASGALQSAPALAAWLMHTGMNGPSA